MSHYGHSLIADWKRCRVCGTTRPSEKLSSAGICNDTTWCGVARAYSEKVFTIHRDKDGFITVMVGKPNGSSSDQ